MNIRYIYGSDSRIVDAARISFAGFANEYDDNRNIKLLKYLYKNEHMSPFEHVIIYIDGIYEFDLKRYPYILVYYDVDNNMTVLTLRSYFYLRDLNILNIDEQLYDKLPAVIDIINGNEPMNFKKESRVVTFKYTQTGFIGLIDKTEFNSYMDYYTFVVECPLFIARQWFRHRFGSFNEVSRRYVNYNPDFYIPTKFRKQSKNNKQASIDEYIQDNSLVKEIRDLVNKSTELYNKILNYGIAKEIARSVLPQSMETRFYWTVPRISLDNFVRLRSKEDAQFEIREFANCVIEFLENR